MGSSSHLKSLETGPTRNEENTHKLQLLVTVPFTIFSVIQADLRQEQQTKWNMLEQEKASQRQLTTIMGRGGVGKYGTSGSEGWYVTTTLFCHWAWSHNSDTIKQMCLFQCWRAPFLFLVFQATTESKGEFWSNQPIALTLRTAHSLDVTV